MMSLSLAERVARLPVDAQRRLAAQLGLTSGVAANSDERDDTQHSTSLVAYYVTRTGRDLSADDLRQQLGQTLPAHLIPTRFRRIEHIPRTLHGKVDAAALPDPVPAASPVPTPRASTSSAIERDLLTIWQSVLGIARVGPQDSFFELGGDSLLAIRLLGRIRERWDIDLSMADIFDQPTVAGAARQIELLLQARTSQPSHSSGDDNAPGDVELQAGPRTARVPLSPGQQRLWAMVSREPDSRRYNLPLAFRLHGPLDESTFRRAVRAVVDRHDVLRSVIRHDDSETWAELRDDVAERVVQVEPAVANADAVWINRRIVTEANRLFDLSNGPLIRVVMVPLGVHDQLLMLTMHHIVADGWSFQVFFDELADAYDAVLAGESGAPAPLVLQYADVAAWQHRRLTPERRTQASQFWRVQFADAPAPLGLHRSRPAAADVRVTTQLPRACIDACEVLGGAEGTTAFAVCLTAYASYLAAVTGSPDAILCTPAVGRERDELQGIIGYINNVLPLRIRVDRTATFRELLRRVRQLLLQALEWQDLPFQDIAALPETQRIPLTRGMFSYGGRTQRSLRLRGCTSDSLSIPDRSVDFDLGLSIEAGDATLSCRDGVLGDIGAGAFLARYAEWLQVVIAHPDRPLAEARERVEVPALHAGETPMPERSVGTPAPPLADATQMMVGLTRDPLELQLAVIWERLFDIHPIAPDADFFALGGHSLLAVELLNTIEREMGTRLTLSELAAHPTISALARVLIDTGWVPTPGALIPMKTGAVGAPFVLLHSFEGHLFLYNELAQHLGAHHAVFGCQAAGIDGRTRPQRSVEAMAGLYLAQIDEQLGDGPIVLGAMCFGVSVGLEIARRRSSAGKPTHLMLIDSAWEHVVPLHGAGPRPGLAARLRARVLRDVTRGHSWLQESLRMITGSPYAQREARIRRRTAKAWLDYTPPQFDGRITLLRTRPTSPGESDWKVESLERLATGDFATVYVPGEHFTVLRAPFVASLADAMIAAVNRPVVPR